MKRVVGRFAALLATALAVAPFTGSDVKGQYRPGSDPDLPPGLVGDNVDKAAFMHARAEHMGLLRGVPHFLPYDPRVRALRETMEIESRTPQIDPAFWTQIGPAPIPNGQVVSCPLPPCPVNGRTVAIAVHPTNPDIVYIGAAQGGVYRSTDGGLNWTPIFDNAMTLAIGSVVLAPSNPEILYVGTGEPNGSADSFFGVGLYRIDNASTTATLVGPIDPPVPTLIAGTTAFTGRAISQVLVHPTDPATIFVATYTGTGGNPSGGSVGFTVPPLALLGLYRSTNATSANPSFTRLTVTTAGSIAPDTSGNRSIRDIVFDPADPNIIVAWVTGAAAAGDGGLYRTTNALAATPVFTQVVTSTVQLNAPGELTANRVGGITRMWSASGDGPSQGLLRRSTDGGATWVTAAGGGGFCNPQCFYDIAVAAHPTLMNTVHLGGAPNTVHSRSTDGGDTFTAFTAGLHVDTHAIEYAPSNPNIMYFASDGGIWRSTDEGVTWTSRNNTSFHAAQFQSGAAHPTDPEFYIGGTQDNGTNYRRANGTWFRTDGGDGGYAIIDTNSDLVNATMYHTYFNSTGQQAFSRVLTVAEAEAGSWTCFGCGFGGCAANGFQCGAATTAILFYAPMARGPGNPNTIYFGSDKLYRSTNQGATMTVVSQSPIISGQAITTIGIAPSDDNVRIVGLRNGQIFATTTGSSTLTNITSASMPGPNPNDTNQRRAVGRAVIDPTNPNIAYVTFGGYTVPAGQHIWKTTNLAGGAATWFQAGSGIPDVPVNALVIDPASPSKLYAGTDIGVFLSTDGGGTWIPYNTGLPRVAVFDITFHNGATRVLRVATHGRGIWERTPLVVPVKLQGVQVE